MVSFSCEACGDVLTKKKLDPHRRGCRGATFTCIDCMVYFPGVEYRSHTSCMTEEQKYQGALYKPKQNKKQQPQQQQQQQQQQPQQHQQQQPAMNSHRMGMANTLALQPFVEDVGEDKEYESWHEYEITNKSPTGPPPEAPTPPSAADDEHVNVFDFLDNSQTPTASNVSRTRDRKPSNADDTTSLVRYETKTGELLEPASIMDQDGEPLVQYGTGPVPTADFVTPKPKTERRRSSKERGTQKDKKRKRLHIDVTGDQIMADAPPVLHSGLTGGLKNMMRPTLPPSPDYSGDNIADLSPTSPLKKSKHSRHHKSSHHHHQSTTSIFGMIAGAPPKTKSSKRKSSSSSSSKKHSHKHEKKSPKLIEYRPGSKDGKGDHGGQMVVFKPRADVFLSFVNKGPESERGCSMNKALKRFHRERQAAGDNVPKIKEEKELWRSLRLRRNDRGEIVLFCEE